MMHSNSKMPILQMYKPANPYGIENDHQYLAKSPSEMLLESMGVTKITEEERHQIEENTRDQANSITWQGARAIRMTSSTFGKICKATDRCDKEELAQSFLSFSNINAVPLKHGIKYEVVAREAYENKTGQKVKKCGLFIDVTMPFLAASPDGLVDDELLIEVKCPYTSRDKAISPAYVTYLRSIDGELKLKTNHNYYYQIQGQLMITGRKMCDLVIFTFCDLQVIRIMKDEEFCKNMRSALQSFFNEYHKPALLKKFFYRDYAEYSF